MGNVNGTTGVNKFGLNSDVDAAEDIWTQGGDFVEPTTARTHDIVSTSTADDGDVAGTGAHTIRVWGLTGWGAAEVTEDLTLDGQTNVATANAYVFINRMQILAAGSGGTNAGLITATAQTDSTVSAAIAIGEGQTLQAIYGLPSTQTFYMSTYHTTWYGAAGAGVNEVKMQLLVEDTPATATSLFVAKHTAGMVSSGDSRVEHHFEPYFAIPGPAIIKIRCTATSAANAELSAGFDGFLVDN